MVKKSDGFPIGATVRLKSGGPDMAVEERDPLVQPGKIVCQWFSGKKLERGFFAPETLELVQDAEKDSHS